MRHSYNTTSPQTCGPAEITEISGHDRKVSRLLSGKEFFVAITVLLPRLLEHITRVSGGSTVICRLFLPGSHAVELDYENT